MVVAVDVAQALGEGGERALVDAAVVLEAVPRALLELLEPPARAGHAHHRHVQRAAAGQALERGEDLLVGEIAGGAEEDEGVGGIRVHRGPGR